MRCTLEGDTGIPRSLSSRATRSLPHSGRSLASASTAAFTERAALTRAPSLLLCPRIVAVGAAHEVRRGLGIPAEVMGVLRIRTQRPRTSRERVAGRGGGPDTRPGAAAVPAQVTAREEPVAAL